MKIESFESNDYLTYKSMPERKHKFMFEKILFDTMSTKEKLRSMFAM